MQVSFKINPNPPPIDHIDEYAKILFQVFNEGMKPDIKFKGVFTKPYTRFDDYESIEKLVEPMFYCDQVIVDNGQNVAYSYGWREWGPHAQKILSLLEKNKEKETAGMTEGLI